MKSQVAPRPRRAAVPQAREAWLFPLLSLAGLLISAYLSYTHITYAKPLCGGLGDCELVNNSRYAEVGGVPVAVLGATMYGGLLALGFLWAKAESKGWLLLAIFGISAAGTLYSAYLTYVEFFVLMAVCIWCLASAALVSAIFALSFKGLARA